MTRLIHVLPEISIHAAREGGDIGVVYNGV